jgi:ABC-type sugar transport system substrate-binding protein
MSGGAGRVGEGEQREDEVREVRGVGGLESLWVWSLPGGGLPRDQQEPRLAAIASDGFHGGRLAAQYMTRALMGKSGTVLLLADSPSITSVVQWADGFIVGMAKLGPNVRVLPIMSASRAPA